MNAPGAEPRPWRGLRWTAAIILVFGAQAGLIFWLGEHHPPSPRTPGPTPAIAFAGEHPGRLTALTDPTVFALPRSRGPAEDAWRSNFPTPYRPFKWVATNEWLTRVRQPLSQGPGALAETRRTLPEALDRPPQPVLPVVPPLTPWRAQTSWRIEGDLAKRRLLEPLTLTSWSTNALLATTTVQMLVAGHGRPVSVMLLARSSSDEADRQALEQARAARFEPIISEGPGQATDPLSRLSWGKLIVDWHTAPAPEVTTEDEP
jgi:hypothetical protein